MPPKNIFRHSIAVCIFAQVFVVLPGKAQTLQVEELPDSTVVYAGGTAGDGVGVYAGGLTALPGSQLGKGLAIRGGVNGGFYEYQSGSVRVTADYVGAELALVYQLSGDWGWANLGAGPRITKTNLSIVDPGNNRDGTRFDLGLSTDGALGDAWRLGWFGSYGVFDQSYIAQLRLGSLLSTRDQLRLGVEGGLIGDPSYMRKSIGGFVSALIVKKWEGQLSIGASKQEGASAQPYVSVGASHVF